MELIPFRHTSFAFVVTNAPRLLHGNLGGYAVGIYDVYAR